MTISMTLKLTSALHIYILIEVPDLVLVGAVGGEPGDREILIGQVIKKRWRSRQLAIEISLRQGRKAE
jgi:hypothetical protein